MSIYMHIEHIVQFHNLVFLPLSLLSTHCRKKYPLATRLVTLARPYANELGNAIISEDQQKVLGR